MQRLGFDVCGGKTRHANTPGAQTQPSAAFLSCSLGSSSDRWQEAPMAGGRRPPGLWARSAGRLSWSLRRSRLPAPCEHCSAAWLCAHPPSLAFFVVLETFLPKKPEFFVSPQVEGQSAESCCVSSLPKNTALPWEGRGIVHLLHYIWLSFL